MASTLTASANRYNPTFSDFTVTDHDDRPAIYFTAQDLPDITAKTASMIYEFTFDDRTYLRAQPHIWDSKTQRVLAWRMLFNYGDTVTRDRAKRMLETKKIKHMMCLSNGHTIWHPEMEKVEIRRGPSADSVQRALAEKTLKLELELRDAKAYAESIEKAKHEAIQVKQRKLLRRMLLLQIFMKDQPVALQQQVMMMLLLQKHRRQQGK